MNSTGPRNPHEPDGGPPRRPRVLAIAFACEPDAGSEGGAGWGMVRTLAEVADVTALVRSHHMPAIMRWQRHNEQVPIEFVEVPMPVLSRLLAQGSRFNRLLWFVAYLGWMRNAKRVAMQLVREGGYDVSVHVSYGSYWLPSPVSVLPIPSVWGPVGGGTRTPRRLWGFLGGRGLAGELAKRAALRLGTLLPATRRTWRRSTIRLVETENTRRVLPPSLQQATRVVNRGPLQEVPEIRPRPRASYLLFPSRLVGNKGGRLALEALTHTPDSVTLRFVADGYDRKALEAQARGLGIAHRVEFRGRIPRAEMFEMMAEAAGVVFTGLREEGGCALSEAMQLGTPVIVLGHGGARQIAEANTDASRVAIIEPGPARQTARRMGAAMTKFTQQPSGGTGPFLDRLSTKQAIHQALADAIANGSGAHPAASFETAAGSGGTASAPAG